MKRAFCLLPLLFLMLISSDFMYAQDRNERFLSYPEVGDYDSLLKRGKDTAYIANYMRLVTLKAYMIQQYNNINVGQNGNAPAINYRPASAIGIGAGFNYRWLGLGAAIKLVKPDEEKGKTKAMDFQTQVLAPKVISLINAQFYKGYYVDNEKVGWGLASKYYLRPDVKSNILGASTYYSFNNKRFTYASTLVLNERQKKSAGSLLAGIDLYYGRFLGDSAIIPTDFQSNYDNADFNRVRYWSIGPAVGYAYTFVYKKYWFASLSAIGNLSFSFTKESNDEIALKSHKTDLNYLLLGAVGYNNDRWNLSYVMNNNMIRFASATQNDDYAYYGGRNRIMFAYRMHIGRKTKRWMRPFDELLDLPTDVIRTFKNKNKEHNEN